MPDARERLLLPLILPLCLPLCGLMVTGLACAGPAKTGPGVAIESIHSPPPAPTPDPAGAPEEAPAEPANEGPEAGPGENAELEAATPEPG